MATTPTGPRGSAGDRERWLPAALVAVGGAVTVAILVLGGIDALTLLLIVATIALVVLAVPQRGARWLVLLVAGILGTALLTAFAGFMTYFGTGPDRNVPADQAAVGRWAFLAAISWVVAMAAAAWPTVDRRGRWALAVLLLAGAAFPAVQLARV